MRRRAPDRTAALDRLPARSRPKPCMSEGSHRAAEARPENTIYLDLTTGGW
jgi:hypothetical protein